MWLEYGTYGGILFPSFSKEIRLLIYILDSHLLVAVYTDLIILVSRQLLQLLTSIWLIRFKISLKYLYPLTIPSTTQYKDAYMFSWCHNRMKTFSALLSFCVGNLPVTDKYIQHQYAAKCALFTLSWCSCQSILLISNTLINFNTTQLGVKKKALSNVG